MTDKFVLISYI